MFCRFVGTSTRIRALVYCVPSSALVSMRTLTPIEHNSNKSNVRLSLAGRKRRTPHLCTTVVLLIVGEISEPQRGVYHGYLSSPTYLRNSVPIVAESDPNCFVHRVGVEVSVAHELILSMPKAATAG